MRAGGASKGPEIRDALVRRILEGRYRAGERLLELRLAAEFATSQAPVREALRELEALHFVATTRYRGTRVRDIPPTEMRDAFQLRALIEREAATAAARANAGPQPALWTAVRGIERAARAGDVRGYVRHDQVFHRTLVALSGNAVLQRHWELLLVPARIAIVLRSRAIDMSRTATEHRPILEAVERGDAARAGRLAYAHVHHIAMRLGPETTPGTSARATSRSRRSRTRA